LNGERDWDGWRRIEERKKDGEREERRKEKEEEGEGQHVTSATPGPDSP
jgi:hypothetical protein